MSSSSATLSFGAAVDHGLSVRSFVAEEGISRLFSVTVMAMSHEQIDLETLIGADVTLTFEGGRSFDREPLTWAGICHRAEQVRAEPTGLSTYRVKIAPKLWLLTQRRNHRVFQHQTIPDVVDQVLAGFGVEAKRELSGKYPKLPYKVQYDETDFDFVSRLLEDAGIAYTFDHRQASQLTFGDGLSSKAPRTRPIDWVDNPNEAPGREFVEQLHLSHDLRASAYTVRDYDFRRPAYALFGDAGAPPLSGRPLEHFDYRPGAFLIEEQSAGRDTSVADDRGAARASADEGKTLAKRSLAALRGGHRTAELRTNVLDLHPGVRFRVERHPSTEIQKAVLLVTERTVDYAVDREWTVNEHANMSSEKEEEEYRPPRVTPKPVVSGVQSAVVTVRANDEITTDEFSRVHVLFPWDREGRGDDTSSCWVRVSQGWAGTGFGLITIPRKGQEVLVGFLEGDPDQPIIVGRVFNSTNRVPYALPENKTRSTWKSQSSPHAEGFNELTFEDLAGEELVWFQAQRDHRKLVKNDETITVGGNRQKLVKKNELESVLGERYEVTEGDRVELTKSTRTTVIAGERSELVKADAIEQIDGDHVVRIGVDRHTIVKGKSVERVDRDRHLEVRGSRFEHIGGAYGLSAGSHQISCGSHSVGAGGNIHHKAGAKIVLEAPSITLKAPGGFIVIDGAGVTIQGSMVWINCGSSAPSIPAGGGGNPEKPKEAKVPIPEIAEPEEVTGIDR